MRRVPLLFDLREASPSIRKVKEKKVLAILPDLWYTEERSTGDDDRVPCGVMLRIVSGPEGSSTKQILARAAGYAWFESVGFFMHDSSPRSARDFGPSKRGLFYALQRQKPAGNFLRASKRSKV